jgi:predicted nucleotidyltransferase
MNRKREEAISVFLGKLIEQEKDNLLAVILYGSVARGDFREDSDTDVFILLKDGPYADIDKCSQITSIACEVDLQDFEYRASISLLIYTLEEYQNRSGAPLFKNIENEGIRLYMTPHQNEDFLKRRDMSKEQIAQDYMEASLNALIAVERNRDDPDTAIDRAYYSALYVVRCLLAFHDLFPSPLPRHTNISPETLPAACLPHLIPENPP